MTTTSTTPASRWPRQSASFALGLFAYYGYIGVLSPYASLFFASHGMSAAGIGLLMSLMQIMRILGPNLWGWLADHTGRRVAVLRLTALGAALALCGLFFSSGFLHFFLVMVLVNLFTSAQSPLTEALMLSEMRGDLTYYGRLRLWGSIGFVVVAAAAGALFDRQGIRLMPWVALTLLCLLFFASLRLRDTAAVPTGRASPSVWSLLRRKAVIAFFLSTFLMIAAHAALYVFYSLYLERAGYSKTVIGMLWSLGVLAEIVFFYFQAPLFSRFGVARLMQASLLIAVVRFLLIGLGVESLLLMLVAQLMHAATFGTHHSASIATLQRWFAGPLQARGQALYTSLSYGLGGSLGGLVMGACWDAFGPRSAYVVAAACSLLAFAAATLSYRWQSQGKE